jgi:integrase
MRTFPPTDDGTLFTTRFGDCYRHDYYGRTIFSAAVDAAGLPKVTSHDLRHHFASVLLAAGESMVAVAERLGHENATLVLKTLRASDARQRGPDAPSHRRGVV